MAQKQRERRKPREFAPTRRKSCHFCKDGITEVDYKNVAQLRRYVSEKGKIRSRRITGACRRHQSQVAVAAGDAPNFLRPRRLAEPATPARVSELEKIDAQRARHEASTVDHAQEIATALAETELRFDVKAGPTGVLFGSVTPTDIADEI